MEHFFQKLYVEVYPRLVRQAAFLLGDPVAAEDAAQEAFARLHHAGLSSIQNPSGWLMKVTNNICYDYLRSEGSRRRREEKTFRQLYADSFATAAPSAEMSVLDRENFQLVHRTLERLQPRDRMLLLLKFSGYSYGEIAEAVDINKGSVGTLLARARERFKREYQSQQ